MPRASSRRHAVWTLILVAGVIGCSGPTAPCAQTSGDAAARDYYAPLDFEVVDAEAVAADAARAGEALPLVVRRDGSVTDVVVAEFNAAFRRTRESYLAQLEAAFGDRIISSRELNSARFRSFRSEFQAANPLFPVNHVLAQTWAKGYDGEDTRERLAAALAATLRDALIGEVRPASTIYLVNLSPHDRIRSWGEAAPHARLIERSEIVGLEAAGNRLRQSLDVLDRGAGGFMTGLLRPTVLDDTFLTGLLLRERLGERVAARRYPQHAPIVRQGQPLDRTTTLALAHLSRMGAEPLTALPPAPVAAAPESPAVVTPAAPAADTANPAAPRWPVIALAATAAALLIASGATVFIVLRRPRRAPGPQGEWLEKVPEPNQPRDRSLREALIPHLARELKNRLVQALFAQRQALLHNEAAASQRVAELEARLAKLQPAIAEKIRAYEKRIQALEAEIEEKDQETRDLLRAKLVLARKELDAEIARHRRDWN